MIAHSLQGNRKDMHIPNMGSISAARIRARDASRNNTNGDLELGVLFTVHLHM